MSSDLERITEMSPAQVRYETRRAIRLEVDELGALRLKLGEVRAAAIACGWVADNLPLHLVLRTSSLDDLQKQIGHRVKELLGDVLPQLRALEPDIARRRVLLRDHAAEAHRLAMIDEAELAVCAAAADGEQVAWPSEEGINGAQ